MRRTTSSAVRRVADLPIAVATDIGLVRTENQDRAAIFRVQLTNDKSTIIAILCDGMGGMTDGATCSSLAISTFLFSFYQNTNLPLKDQIVTSVIEANDIVFAKYKGSGGSTLSAIIIDPNDGVLGVNVGDSRIYSMEDQSLSQMTVDDTLAGQFAQGDENYYRSNELLQYIGMEQSIEPHIISLPTKPKLSSVLLTSDGVHFLDKCTIELVSNHASDSALAMRRLIELAKWCGGHDNASAISLNLSTIELGNANLNVGDIEVWDAFGELRLINIEEVALNTKSSITPKNDKTKEPAPKIPRRRKRSAPKVKEKKIKDDIKKQSEIKDLPQLQIDFDNT